MNLVFSLSLISREYWSYLGTPITHLYPIGWFLHSRTQRLVVEEQQLLLQPQITAAGIEKLQPFSVSYTPMGKRAGYKTCTDH